MDEACSRHGERIKAYKILAGKLNERNLSRYEYALLGIRNRTL
jgi:hypothetical protein